MVEKVLQEEQQLVTQAVVVVEQEEFLQIQKLVLQIIILVE